MTTNTTIKLRWDREPPSNIKDVEDAICTDLSSSMYADLLDRPWDLLTHTVFLGPSMTEGPCVHMWGVEDDDHFHCSWEEEIKWVSLKDWEDSEIG